MSKQIALGNGAQPPVVLEQRIRELEATVATLTEATALLVRALEASPLTEADDAKTTTQAARKAHEILIAAGLSPAKTEDTDK